MAVGQTRDTLVGLVKLHGVGLPGLENGLVLGTLRVLELKSLLKPPKGKKPTKAHHPRLQHQAPPKHTGPPAHLAAPAFVPPEVGRSAVARLPLGTRSLPSATAGGGQTRPGPPGLGFQEPESSWPACHLGVGCSGMFPI